MYNSADPQPDFEREEVTFTGLSKEQRDRLIAIVMDSVSYDYETGTE
jgi:hypothetical protein